MTPSLCGLRIHDLDCYNVNAQYCRLWQWRGALLSDPHLQAKWLLWKHLARQLTAAASRAPVE